MPKANIAHIVLTLCFISLFLIEISYSTEQVVIQFVYLDPSTIPGACPTCPGWQQAYSIYQEKMRIIDGIKELYGDKVVIERIDFRSSEGKNLISEYAPIYPQFVMVNHEVKIEGDGFTEENLTKVIDEYLAGEEFDGNLVQPLTIAGAFSLGFFDTFSPCLIAMLSFILSYTLGETIRFRTGMLRVMTFGIGFVSAAVLLGAAVALMLISMPSIQIALMWIICIFAILFGLNLSGLLKIPIQTKPLVKKLAGKYTTTYMGLLLLGFIFYFLDPCLAPFAFTMLLMLQNSEFILPLLMFCLGVFIPFIGIGIVAGYASKLARSTYKHRAVIRAVSGLILIIYALYLIFFILL